MLPSDYCCMQASKLSPTLVSTVEAASVSSRRAVVGFKECYFVQFPDGRDRQTWSGLTYVRTRPRWLRFGNFNETPLEFVEIAFA